MSSQTVSLLQSDDTFASTLFIIAANTFGQELLGGDYGSLAPETIRIGIEQNYGVKLSDDNLGKIMAATAVVTTDNLMRTLPSFLFTLHALQGDGLDWSYGEPLETEDLAWGIMESFLLYPPDEDTHFDPQIVGYCQQILSREGIKSPPTVLAFAAQEDSYADLGLAEDMLTEQADRTNAVNEYLEEQQQRLLLQLEQIDGLGLKAETILAAIQTEMSALAADDKWL
jgi:hypothetical protein